MRHTRTMHGINATTPMLALVLLFTLPACQRTREADRDLAAIRAADTLVVGTRYNSTSYFLYRGAAMGYEYELLRAFAESQDLILRMVVASDYDQLVELLHTGAVDVVAARLVPGGVLDDRVAFTHSLFETPRVLVQRTGPPEPQTRTQSRLLPDTTWGADLPPTVTVRARRIASPGELAGERVHVGEESAAYDRLIELSDSIDGSIEIVEVEPDVSTETLIRRVAAGQIEFTVSREKVAQLQTERYTNIEVAPVMGPPAGLAWGVRTNAGELLTELNR
jgi:membrane-bound lytic murein transglycosylase F